MRGKCFSWETENCQSPAEAAGPAHSPASHVTPAPVMPLQSLSPAPHSPAWPWTLQTRPTSWAGAARGDPNAPRPQGAAFSCSLTLQPWLSSPAWLSSSLGWHSEGTHSLQLKPEASGYKARRGRVTGACRYQKLHCNHKYGNTMPKNNLNSTSHICN